MPKLTTTWFWKMKVFLEKKLVWFFHTGEVLLETRYFSWPSELSAQCIYDICRYAYIHASYNITAWYIYLVMWLRRFYGEDRHEHIKQKVQYILHEYNILLRVKSAQQFVSAAVGVLKLNKLTKRRKQVWRRRQA